MVVVEVVAVAVIGHKISCDCQLVVISVSIKNSIAINSNLLNDEHVALNDSHPQSLPCVLT